MSNSKQFDALRAFMRSASDAHLNDIVAAVQAVPVDMVLFCPACGTQHIDAPDHVDDRNDCDKANDMVGTSWTNPPHRSHLCHSCGHIWRPADVPTNGVAAVATRGANDGPLVAPHTLRNWGVPILADGTVYTPLKENTP